MDVTHIGITGTTIGAKAPPCYVILGRFPVSRQIGKRRA
jgi:hypothetical protein